MLHEAPVNRRQAHVPRRGELTERVVVVVEQAERLGHTLLEEGPRAHERVHASDVVAPQVQRRMPVPHPLGADLAEAPRALDADAVEARGHEVAAPAGYRPDVELVVRRERFRAAEEAPPAGVPQDRHARHGVLEHRHQLIVHVPGQLVEAEVPWNSPLPPRHGALLERADQQGAGVLLDVYAPVVIAQQGQVPRHRVELPGDRVVVLAGMQGDVDARPPAELPRPHAAAVDDEVGGDGAGIGAHARHAVPVEEHVLDGDALETGGAASARALDERHRDPGGIALAVVLDEGAADQARGVDERKERPDLRGRDLVDARDAEGVVARAHAPELLPAVLGVGDRQAADLTEARALSRLALDVAEQAHGVLGEPCVALARAHGADEPGGVPGGAAGEPASLDEQHVLPAELREVVGDARAGDAAADDDGAGAGGEAEVGRVGGHGSGGPAGSSPSIYPDAGGAEDGNLHAPRFRHVQRMPSAVPTSRRPLADVDLRLLRGFRTVAACGGLAAAELEPNIGRSAISRHLADLEVRLGMTLCRRGPGGFALSVEGERVLESTRRLLEATDAFRGEIDDIAARLVGTLRFACFDLSSGNPGAHVDRAVARFADAAPDVALEVSVVPPLAIEAGLASGRFDVGVVPLRGTDPALERTPLYDESMVLCCGTGHALGGVDEGALTPEDLVGHPYAGFDFDSTNLHMGQRLRLRTSARVQSEEALAVLILSDRYLGFLPSHVARPFIDAGRMRTLLPASTRYPSTMAAVTRRRPAPGRSATLFVEVPVAAHRAGAG